MGTTDNAAAPAADQLAVEQLATTDQAEAPAVAQTADLERYTEPYSIWAALETGHVVLIRASWLVKHAKAGGVLSRRQDLPEEAFMSLAELKAMYGDGNKDGVLPIIAISL